MSTGVWWAWLVNNRNGIKLISYLQPISTNYGRNEPHKRESDSLISIAEFFKVSQTPKNCVLCDKRASGLHYGVSNLVPLNTSKYRTTDHLVQFLQGLLPAEFAEEERDSLQEEARVFQWCARITLHCQNYLFQIGPTLWILNERSDVASAVWFEVHFSGWTLSVSTDDYSFLKEVISFFFQRLFLVMEEVF